MRVIAATCSTSAAATTTKHLHLARHRLMNVIALRADPARAQAAHVEVCHRTKPNTRERVDGTNEVDLRVGCLRRTRRARGACGATRWARAQDDLCLF